MSRRMEREHFAIRACRDKIYCCRTSDELGLVQDPVLYP